jgi:hypothetical protein
LQLLEIPDSQLVGRPPSFGRLGVHGDVVCDQSFAAGVGEGLWMMTWTSSTVLPSRPPRPLRRTLASSSAYSPFEVLGAQATQWHGAEPRDDVQLDDAAMAVPGAGPKAYLLGGAPASQQERRQRQPGLPLDGRSTCRERGGELFSFGPIGAGRVPASPFPAGEGVDAFVDDGVEPGALLCDVALYDDDLLRWRRGATGRGSR